jgi:predicted dithiol-disulfide oxidoreductase (DUF899 family)
MENAKVQFMDTRYYNKPKTFLRVEMKNVVFYKQNKGWRIRMVSETGTTNNKTYYATMEEAKSVAAKQNPSCKIIVEEQFWLN